MLKKTLPEALNQCSKDPSKSFSEGNGDGKAHESLLWTLHFYYSTVINCCQFDSPVSRTSASSCHKETAALQRPFSCWCKYALMKIRSSGVFQVERRPVEDRPCLEKYHRSEYYSNTLHRYPSSILLKYLYHIYFYHIIFALQNYK